MAVLTGVRRNDHMTQATRSYRDLHEHLQALEKRGLIRTIERLIDKDSELHPLVRWQFVGGLDEENRKAFLLESETAPWVRSHRCRYSHGWKRHRSIRVFR